MTDINKVVRGLKCCVEFDKNFECSNNCPYDKTCSEEIAGLTLHEDCLMLIKEQHNEINELKAMLDHLTGYIHCNECHYGESEMGDSIYYCNHPGHSSVGHTSKYFCADGCKNN